MWGFLREKVAPSVRVRGPQKGLVDALYSTEQLRLDYDSAITRTASEAFDARAGNCLSLVIMTSAFAKGLGLDVRYQELMVDEVWVRAGDLIQLVGHVNVSLGRGQGPLHLAKSPTDWITVDFVPVDDNQRQRARIVAERRIISMYFNNRGAEAITAGRPGEAYWWARAAVLQDPAYSPSFVTLGVAARRSNRFDLAERAYRRALEFDSHNEQALHNLAELLHLQGREDEAVRTARLLETVRPDSLAVSYRRGLSAFNAGNFPMARDAFAKALRLAPDDSEINFLLALTHFRLGDSEEAVEHMRHARDTTTTAERRRALTVKLTLLDKALHGRDLPAGPADAGP